MDHQQFAVFNFIFYSYLYFLQIKEIELNTSFFILLIVVLTIIAAFAIIAYWIYIKKIIAEKNNRHQQELNHQKAILEQQASVQESERKRIAEMLHDDVGNKLNVLSLWLNNEDTWNNERSKEIVTQQIPQLIDAVRTISTVLYPANLEQFGLVFTLEELIANIDDSLKIVLFIQHRYHKRAVAFEVQVYRIIQEFLNNVIRHSQASEMTIQIRDGAKALAIALTDNGIGFEKKSVKTGMGLRNIQSRLESNGAHYKWKSKKNSGSRLIFLILKND